MAGEAHLDVWREDAHLRGVRGVLRRQDERRLREVHLVRDPLHQPHLNVLRVEHHRELVARQRLVGEHVDDSDLVRHFTIRHVVVACASSFPVLTATSLPSAVATVPPRWITTPSHRTRPVSSVIGRTKFVFTSSVV